jgi:hypothetical protein
MASDSPSSDMVLRVKPNAHTATNEASTETGSARPVITVERHEFRKRNTTSTVSSAPSRSASCTLASPSGSPARPRSRTTSSFTPGGSVASIFAPLQHPRRRRRPWCCSPWLLMMSIPTAGRPLKSASERGSSVPSRTVATSPRRIERRALGHHQLREARRVRGGAPCSRMERSSSSPFSAPPARPGSAPAAPAPPAHAHAGGLHRCGSSSTVSSR